MVWHDMLRRLHQPLPTVLDAGRGQPRLKLDMLDADALRVRRIALHGACSAAEEFLVTAPLLAAPYPGTARVWVDAETARRCFENVDAQTLSCTDSMRTFRPTTFLFEENLRGRDCSFFCLEDDAAPAGIDTGLAAVVSIGSPQVRTLGETFFVPPVPPCDGAARDTWIRSRHLDPPRHGEPGGPFWRLGRHGLWRLDVLAWNEILVLAALLGTSANEAVVVAPRHLLPSVGFVAEVARQMARTLIGVPLEACPRHLRCMWRDSHRIGRATAMSLFSDVEGMDGGFEPEGAPARARPRRPR